LEERTAFPLLEKRYFPRRGLGALHNYLLGAMTCKKVRKNSARADNFTWGTPPKIKTPVVPSLHRRGTPRVVGPCLYWNVSSWITRTLRACPAGRGPSTTRTCKKPRIYGEHFPVILEKGGEKKTGNGVQSELKSIKSEEGGLVLGTSGATTWTVPYVLNQPRGG